MIYRLCIVALAFVGCASFQLSTFSSLQTTQHQSSSYYGSRKGQSLYMGGAKGVISTQAGKAERVEAIVEDLKKSTMIAKAFNSGLTVKQMSILRDRLPESTKVSVVKNTLMRRALEDVPEYGVIDPTLTGSNMWFFIEDDIKGTLKAYKKFLDEQDKDLEVYDFGGGCIDGELLDASGVKAVGKLPSKLELYAQIAGLINAVPTKLARSINAVPQKLAVAVNLALVDGKEEGGESAE